MNWLFCCGARYDVVEPMVSVARVLDNPQLHRFLANENVAQNSAGSSGSCDSKLTTARRQTMLDLHRRRIRVRELQDMVARERELIDDLILELAIT